MIQVEEFYFYLLAGYSILITFLLGIVIHFLVAEWRNIKRAEILIEKYNKGFLNNGVYKILEYGSFSFSKSKSDFFSKFPFRYIVLFEGCSCSLLHFKIRVILISKYDFIDPSGKKIHPNIGNLPLGKEINIIGETVQVPGVVSLKKPKISDDSFFSY